MNHFVVILQLNFERKFSESFSSHKFSYSKTLFLNWVIRMFFGSENKIIMYAKIIFLVSKTVWKQTPTGLHLFSKNVHFSFMPIPTHYQHTVERLSRNCFLVQKMSNQATKIHDRCQIKKADAEFLQFLARFWHPALYVLMNDMQSFPKI